MNPVVFIHSRVKTDFKAQHAKLMTFLSDQEIPTDDIGQMQSTQLSIGVAFVVNDEDLSEIPKGWLKFIFRGANLGLFDVREDSSDSFSIQDELDLNNSLQLISLLFKQAREVNQSRIQKVLQRFTPTSKSLNDYHKYLNQDDSLTINDYLDSGALPVESTNILDQAQKYPLYQSKSKLFFSKDLPSVELKSFFLVANILKPLSSDEADSLQPFSQSEYPMVLIQADEVLWMNNAFSREEINHLSVKHRGFVEGKTSRFQVLKLPQADQSVLIIFFPWESVITNPASHGKDLGVITSSIAHELNNPLGGIMAAIDVILLDDLNPEQTESMKAMKKTVIRCKNLVSTFLGFSRREVSGEKENQLDLTSALDQAYDLLKFRLVENSVHFDYQVNVLNEFKSVHNSSVMTMLFYLIFNDLVTNKLHSALVNRNDERQVSLSISVKNHEIKLTSDKELLKSGLKNSLIHHLLSMLALDLQQKEDYILMVCL